MNEKPQSQKLACGRIVHAIVKNAFGTFVERPAIVVRTWGENSTAIQCTVFFDAVNDGGAFGHRSSLTYYGTPCGPATNTPDASQETWHWPTDVHTDHTGAVREG